VVAAGKGGSKDDCPDSMDDAIRFTTDLANSSRLTSSSLSSSLSLSTTTLRSLLLMLSSDDGVSIKFANDDDNGRLLSLFSTTSVCVCVVVSSLSLAPLVAFALPLPFPFFAGVAPYDIFIQTIAQNDRCTYTTSSLYWYAYHTFPSWRHFSFKDL
jgi:hypothetical protein